MRQGSLECQEDRNVNTQVLCLLYQVKCFLISISVCAHCTFMGTYVLIVRAGKMK